MKKGVLYITSTPIGNMEDITLRAIEVLKSVDLVAAEDTRRTGTLMKRHGIERPLTSLHDHNEREKCALIIERLLQGANVAYVSDAGTPGVSDPGYLLVKLAVEQDIAVSAVPGPSAAIAALSVSGLPMNRFTFAGFPPPRRAGRRRFLEELRNEKATMIFYESPKRLAATLRDMLEIFGDRPMSLSRELTKLHEETRRGKIADILEGLHNMTVKGEITLVIGGAEERQPEADPEKILSLYDELAKKESCYTRDAASRIARATGLPRKKVYAVILEHLGKKRPGSDAPRKQ